MDLGVEDFGAYFEAVHGHAPFPWQQRLVGVLGRDDEWPEVLDLPAGAGKTAAIDAAVFHLALRSDEPARAALRICLVVDRHLAVDHSHARAVRIAEALARARPGGGRRVLEAVAARLGALAESPERPLAVHRLPSGTPLEPEWARTPAQPTVLCSTVDQVGSRLLFRGQGLPERIRPVQAGLLGRGALILVDGAHAARPFLQTLRAVRELGGARVKAALLADAGGGDASAFGLSARDRRHPVLRRRLRAARPAVLVRARSRPDPAEVFAGRAVGVLADLARAGVSPAAVAVMVNRVRLARETYRLLRERADCDALLLTGRRRSADRHGAVDAGLAGLRTGAPRDGARPLVVVATQCIEAAVDIDVDGLVTQAAPFDVLRQRFGRLNRDGRDVPARGEIVALPGDLSRRPPEDVYGEATRRTWEALQAVGDGIDFGAGAATEWLGEVGEPPALAAPAGDAPVVMPAYLDLWSRTSPAPASGPDAGLFVRGADAGSPDVSFVWRADIADEDLTAANRDGVASLLSLVPPAAGEAVSVPAWAAREFLADRLQAHSEVADIATRRDGGGGFGGAGAKVAFRWAGRDDPGTGPVAAAEIGAGDVLVVPAERGGCDRHGWAPASRAPVEDLADAAALSLGRRAVRVSGPAVAADAGWARVRRVIDGWSGRDGRTLAREILEALAAEAAAGGVAGEPQEHDVGSRLSALAELRVPVRVQRYAEGLSAAGGVVLVPAGEMPAACTEDDGLDSAATANVGLDRHAGVVAVRVHGYARRLGLDRLAGDLALAARLCGAGKADRRYQAMLAGGEDLNVPDGGPLAKSARGWSAAACRRAGLSPGWRHEALGVRMCRGDPRLADAGDPALVLWLVGSHHGFGRPFFGFAGDGADAEPLPCLGVRKWAAGGIGPESLAFDYGGRTWPDLFDALQRRYGIWELAHLEAIVRLADHRASEPAGGA